MDRSGHVRTRLVALAGALAIAAIAAPEAGAVDLVPGGAVATLGVAGGAGPGVVIHDSVTDFEILGAGGVLLYKGRLQNRVLRLNATGTLAFMYRVRDTVDGLNGIVSDLATIDFAGYATDVDFSATGLGVTGPKRASRSGDGKQVSFLFTGPALFSGVESRFIHIATDATAFAPNGLTGLFLTGGESVVIPTMMPVEDANRGCANVDFEDRPLGAEYPVGSAFVSNGVLIRVKEFYFGPGCTNAFVDGFARIDESPLRCLNDHTVNVNNVNLEFDFGGPVQGLVVHYVETGGNLNLSINGACININDFSQVPASLGGVAITHTQTSGEPGQGCGRLEFDGLIVNFRIGGQELWLDDISCVQDPCDGDRTPPVAEITGPTDESCVCDGPIQIVGTADDPDGTFDHYLLEYRRTTDPSWTTIANSTTPVVNGVLGVWNAGGLPAGNYLLRLTVRNACGLTETDVRLVYLDTSFSSFEVRSPVEGGIYGGRICFDGTVWDRCFDHYVVEYRPAGGGAWTLIETSTTTVVNDPLANWDTIAAGIPDGSYEVRVTAVDDCGHIATETLNIIVDNTAPVSIITDPVPCAYVDGIVTVRGTANDTNLHSWALQYTGGDASGWVTIATGTTPVINDVLANWDTTDLKPCAYTLRLVVTDKAVVNCVTRHRTDYHVSVNVGICGDCDGDGDLDLGDLLIFQANFTGPK